MVRVDREMTLPSHSDCQVDFTILTMAAAGLVLLEAGPGRACRSLESCSNQQDHEDLVGQPNATRGLCGRRPSGYNSRTSFQSAHLACGACVEEMKWIEW